MANVCEYCITRGYVTKMPPFDVRPPIPSTQRLRDALLELVKPRQLVQGGHPDAVRVVGEDGPIMKRTVSVVEVQSDVDYFLVGEVDFVGDGELARGAGDAAVVLEFALT